MLIQITEKDGRQTWINPLHVRWIRQNRGMLGGEKPGAQLGMGDLVPVETPESPSDIAGRVGAALATTLNPALVASVVAATQKQRDSGGDADGGTD